jgi:hypothetical protein
MDKYPEYPYKVGKEVTNQDGETWKTISARGVGFAPTKSETLVEMITARDPEAEI